MMDRRKEYDPTKCEWHEESMNKHEKVLFGNGGQGLIKETTIIKTKLNIILALLVPTVISIAGMIIHIIQGAG